MSSLQTPSPRTQPLPKLAEARAVTLRDHVIRKCRHGPMIHLSQMIQRRINRRGVSRARGCVGSTHALARRGLPGSRASLGIGTVVILGLIGWALGIDPRVLGNDVSKRTNTPTG